MTNTEGSPRFSPVKARALARWKSGLVVPSTARIEPLPNGQVPPASLQQERHWRRRDPATDSTRRNIGFAGRLQAPLDVETFMASVAVVADRHEALRTTLFEKDGQVWQRIHDRPLLVTQVVDFADQGVMGMELAVEDARNLLRSSMDLVRGPLAHVNVYRLGAMDYLIAIICNHVVGDGWSLGIALRDADAIYRASITDAPPDVPPVSLQYGSYAAWQRRWLTSQEARAHADYWSARLRGNRATPFAAGGRTGGEGSGGIIPLEIETDQLARIRAVAAASGSSPFSVMLATYVQVIARHSGPQVPVAFTVARRQRPETRDTIGFFAGAICIEVDLADGPSFQQLVRRVRSACNSGISHAEFDLAAYLTMVEPDRDEDLHPTSLASFHLQPPMPPLTVGGYELEPLDLMYSSLNRGIEIALREVGGRATGAFSYCPGAMTLESARAFVQEYSAALTIATT